MRQQTDRQTDAEVSISNDTAVPQVYVRTRKKYKNVHRNRPSSHSVGSFTRFVSIVMPYYPRVE